MSARIVRVGRSATGLGLFAARPHREAEPLSSPIAASGSRPRRRSGASGALAPNTCSRSTGSWSIDGSSRRNLGRYLNHSCEPNAEAVLRAGQIVFVALRAIAPGEEITLDYGEEYFELYIKPLGCRCAACAGQNA